MVREPRLPEDLGLPRGLARGIDSKEEKDVTLGQTVVASDPGCATCWMCGCNCVN